MESIETVGNMGTKWFENFPNWVYNHTSNTASIYLLEVNNRNNRKKCDLCSKLTIKILKQRQ